MSFINGFSKTAGDVINMDAWKSSHPLHKMKRSMRAAAKAIPRSFRRIPLAVAGGVGLIYGGLAGIGVGANVEKRRRAAALKEHEELAREVKRGKK